MQFTIEQINKLAPDDASAKAGRGLAINSKWQLRCVHDKALWGDCQGSGKTPYRTIVDLTNLAFKCSCPSRKFPCKHGLGLLFLYTDNPSVFSAETELAPHVAEWIDKRVTKAESKPATEKIPNEQTQQKRVESREKKVTDGIAEMRMWLKDVIRTGIINVPQNPYQFNQNIIARMVDSQAGGLANQLRRINQINFYKEGWQKALTKQLSRIYLLTESYNNIQSLPVELQSDIRTLIGWNTAKQEVLATAGVKDEWLVLAITLEEENNLKTERIWLYGIETKKYALILNFYVGAQTQAHAYIVGGTIKGELVYYPSQMPLRALFKDPVEIKSSFQIPSINQNIQELLNEVSIQLSQNPFADQVPYILNPVKVYFEKEQWLIVDNEGKILPLNNNTAECWTILAITRGKHLNGFGIYENEAFKLLSLWQDNQYNSIS
ncbi:SWIM zinc finger family protein [Solitalea sp. MAHUQ-68]|uniref:SWIM zinc finger family protein n=1 Tax=Solitalea agri TaxID=2953739 RepID=A0A9X2F3U9_9SPHI|nr:SWIM zinc finger family protein [Solitalea agri]MCO4294222.1 SWIM zinc finger family protein [Solitalea agri]